MKRLTVFCALLACLLTCTRLRASLLRTSLLIHLLRGSLHDGVEVVDGRVDSGYITTLVGVLQLAESLLDSRFLIGRDLVAVVLEEVANMARLTESVNPDVKPAPDNIKEKHFYRKHGANAYYGQN